MSSYRAPLQEIRFALDCCADTKSWQSYSAFEDCSDDLIDAVLTEAGKITTDLIGPTNWTGDQEGAALTGVDVTTPEAFKPMHQAYVEGGWPSLSGDPEFGGQGLPGSLATAVDEMLASANMAYSLNWMLTSGAISAIAAHGSDEIKAKYLPAMVEGRWSGAMNLTEAQAGSDVGALKAKAQPVGDGTYTITGQKIYITWGDHDLQENVIHLVLARLPGAPEGTRGISMFLVPKFHVNDDGNVGERNDVKCVGLEHKLGIHASPTCVMAFGDEGKCVGYLVGEENRGMANMFTMMNHARVSVGLEGTAIGERAYQMALSHAMERVQSAPIDKRGAGAVAIVEHPDVRRMLTTIRAYTEASRAIIYRNAWAIDRSHQAEDAEERKAAQGEADLLTPISKSWSTDRGVEIASIAVQVFGGMGFVEETGIAQLYRDIRIAPIYEGTNGIQALDLVGRKLHQDGGAHWRALMDEIDGFDPAADTLKAAASTVKAACVELRGCAELLASQSATDINAVAAAASPYMNLFGAVLGAYMLLVQADKASACLAAGEGSDSFMKLKIETALFFVDQLLPPAQGLVDPIKAGSANMLTMDPADLMRA